MPPETRSPPPGGAGERAEDAYHSNNTWYHRHTAVREAAQVLRRRRLVEHLHALGPAPLGHFLDEIADDAGCADAINRKLGVYAAIEPVFVRALRGERAPPILRVVEGAGDEPREE